MEKFGLMHTVLYAKHWYKSSDDIWSDLVKVLEADGYIGTFEGDSPEQIKNRVAYLLVIQLDRIPKLGSLGRLPDFFESIKPYNSWKYGYYTKENSNWSTNSKEYDSLKSYDYNESVARYCLSYFAQLSREKGVLELTRPLDTVLPIRASITEAKINEIFN